MEANGILVPFGILEVKQKQFNVVYGNSLETSDFIVDCLEHWWRYRKKRYQHIERLQIDLDNGPELESCRTQFIKRMIDWSDKIKLPIESEVPSKASQIISHKYFCHFNLLRFFSFLLF